MQEVRALLHAAQQEREAAVDQGRVETPFQVGEQVMVRTKELLDAAEVGKLRQGWEPEGMVAVAGHNTYTRTRDPPCAVQVQSDDQRRPAQALLLSDGQAPLPRPGHRPGPVGGARGGAASQPQDGQRQDILPGAVVGPRLGS